MKKLFVFLCAIIFGFGLFNMANATVLTFDIHGIFANKDIPKSYGDRVISAIMSVDPVYINYEYGTDGGFTPNVTVDYQPDNDPTKSLTWALPLIGWTARISATPTRRWNDFT